MRRLVGVRRVTKFVIAMAENRITTIPLDVVRIITSKAMKLFINYKERGKIGLKW